jgi:hypothetical protein
MLGNSGAFMQDTMMTMENWMTAIRVCGSLDRTELAAYIYSFNGQRTTSFISGG